MKVIASSIVAALANRKATLINAGVGFSTFAVGDALSQGARPQPQGVVAEQRRRRQQKQRAEPSWQRQFVSELQQRTREVDFGRSAKVGLLGIFLNGFALGAWYRVLDRYIGSDRTRIQQVVKKCVIDQFVYAPFSITSFVGYAAVLGGGGGANVLANTKSSLAEHGLETWIMDWKVWPAANLIMFRFIPSSYRPSFASVVQVAWQAYMSRVSYDNPHHHASPSHQPPITATIEAGGSGGVLVRGGGEGARVETAGGGAAKGTGGGGGRRRVGEGIAPPPGFPVVGGSAVDGGPVRRTAMADRRATGRYAYASTSSGTVAARGGDGSVSRAVKDGMNVSGGGGGGGDGVRVLGAARTPPIPSSPLFSKAKEL